MKINNLKQSLNHEKFLSFNFFNYIKPSKKVVYLRDILEENVSEKYFFNRISINNFLEKIKIEDIKEDKRIIKLFDLPKDVHKDNERQRRIYSINGVAPTILARSDAAKILIRKDNLFRIRKLTPIECLRTQGFSEEFIQNLKEINVSDTQLYKQAGNAVSPPVIEAIFNYINDYLSLLNN